MICGGHSDAHRLLRKVVDGECVGAFRCVSACADGIYFQACVFPIGTPLRSSQVHRRADARRPRDSLKEHVIAGELYGKAADFTAAADQTASVDARRQRDKLREWGKSFQFVLVLLRPAGPEEANQLVLPIHDYAQVAAVGDASQHDEAAVVGDVIVGD